jgi:hypothetical protein
LLSNGTGGLEVGLGLALEMRPEDGLGDAH